MKIAICDDQELYRVKTGEKVKVFLMELGINGEVFEYEKGDKLLSDLNIRHYDLIILDIIMGETDGINIAKSIRIINKEVSIVFLSSYEEYAIKGYGLDVSHYLLKGSDEEKLKDIIYSIYKKKSKNIALKIKNEIISFNTNNIYFFEVNNRIITIHYLEDGIYKTKQFYGKLDEIEKQLKGQLFYRSHRSYLVNIRRIKKIISNEIYFDIPIRAMVSRNKFLDLKARYLEYNVEI